MATFTRHVFCGEKRGIQRQAGCPEQSMQHRITVVFTTKPPFALLTHLNPKAPNKTRFNQDLLKRQIFNNIKHLKGGFYPKIFSYLKKYVYLCPTFSEVRPRSPRYITPDCVDAERV